MKLRSIFPAVALVCGIFAADNAHAEAPSLRATALGGVERTDSAPGTGAVNGAYYGVQVGADWSLGPVLVGVEGEIGDSSASALLPGNRARQGRFANAAVRVAVPVAPGLRGFVRGGYAYHRIDYDTGPDFSSGGYTLGGGAELDVLPRLFLRAEYRYSDYGQTVRGQHFLGGIGIKF